MAYVDGYLIVVPKKKIPAYRALAKKASKVWKDHGALEYYESAGDDLQNGHGIPFPKLLKLKPSETAVFSWVIYKSRAHRDRVNAKVMKDKRISEMCNPKDMPFDCNRMSFGGFKIIVSF